MEKIVQQVEVDGSQVVLKDLAMHPGRIGSITIARQVGLVGGSVEWVSPWLELGWPLDVFIKEVKPLPEGVEVLLYGPKGDKRIKLLRHLR